MILGELKTFCEQVFSAMKISFLKKKCTLTGEMDFSSHTRAISGKSSGKEALPIKGDTLKSPKPLNPKSYILR